MVILNHVPFTPGGLLHQIFGTRVQHVKKKNWANQILGFVKMRGQKDLKSMKKGVNWIEN